MVPPTCHWTLDRLQAGTGQGRDAHQTQPDPAPPTAEHLKWQKPRTWLESDRPGLRGKKGAIVGLSTEPPPDSTVICLRRARAGRGAALLPARAGAPMPTARTSGPPTRAMATAGPLGRSRIAPARVFLETASTRDTASWLHFLDGLEAFVPRRAMPT